ncbi:MAG: LuxR C-terminal-related transcriptional regulator, partial [Actinomycetota bacterium]|nr:LuxR C-terminal-related transcriptional regulator [Actinomycetota bacterium]
QTPQPFGPLWDIARDEAHLKKALQESDRQEVLEAVFDLLTGSLSPGLVVIEDTQWSDEATLDAIKYVGRRVGRTKGLLLLTYRDVEVDLDHPLRTVIGNLPPESVTRLELGTLSRSAVSEIIGESGLDPDQVLEVTRGNPFLVTELALAGGDEVPSSVKDSVMARVGSLSPEAREMLKVMSVIPERIAREDVSALTVGSNDQLAECERLGLLEVQGDSVTFRHELIRRAVEASLTISENVAIHRSLLDSLPDDTDPARMVHHARGANDVERLIEFAPRAARAAAALGSHREASAHFRTLEPYLARIDVHDRAGLLIDWALIEYYLANVESIEILDRAISLYRDLGSGEDLARALTLAVAVNETHARTNAAESHAVEAIGILRPFGPSADLAAALSRYADLLIHQGEGVRADGVVDEAIAMGETTGNELAQIRALNVKGMLAHVRGVPGGLGLVEQARSRAEKGSHRFEEVMALRGAAYTAQEINDVGLEQDLAQRARDTAIRYELPLLESEAKAVYADALMRKGDWAAAEDLATETLGSHANADVHLMRILGLLRIRTGHTGGREYLSGAWFLAQESTEVDYLQHVAACLAEEMWLEGRVDAGLTERFRELVERGIRQEFPWLAGWLAFWLWRLDELGHTPEGIPEPHMQVIQGGFAEAAAFWEARRMPYERAMALSCGNTDQRLEALEILDSLGAEAVAAKLRKDLREEGVSVPRGKGRATRRHAAGLTARQAEVLQLLGEALSNHEIADRLFLSSRTVENHVSAVLAKLDASTRDEAVANAHSEGLL